MNDKQSHDEGNVTLSAGSILNESSRPNHLHHSSSQIVMPNLKVDTSTKAENNEDKITPLPSPSMSPASATRIFKKFTNQLPSPHQQVVRKSSLKFSSNSTTASSHQRSSSSTIEKKPNVLGELSQDQIDQLNQVRKGDSRPTYLRTFSDDLDIPKKRSSSTTPPPPPPPPGQVFEAFDNQMHKSTWREIKEIGKGAFSSVVLACPVERFLKEKCEKLVAVKVIKMGDDLLHSNARERIEGGLKREIDIIKSTKHPSLIRLYAFNIDYERAVLVLPYCAGGDLFDLANNHRSSLSIDLIRRIFAETAQAIYYLHCQNIVHRDVKLENVLINLGLHRLLEVDPKSFNKPIVTVTDLGLSRRIDPNNPMLTTRCGSEDYVPPELIMGCEYDGRQCDSWALGVFLYALLEGRLPFDPLNPSHRTRKVAHRIARIEWKWVKLLDDDNEKDAKQVVENCLQKRDFRWSSEDIVNCRWLIDSLPELEMEVDDWIGSVFL